MGVLGFRAFWVYGVRVFGVFFRGVYDFKVFGFWSLGLRF